MPMFNHPVLFAAIAVIAIGVVIYEFISAQQQDGHRERPPKPPPNDRGKPPRPPSNDSGKPPEPPSNDRGKSPGPPSNDSKPPSPPSSQPPKCNETPSDSTVVPPGNNLRRRNPIKTCSNENASENSKHVAQVSSTIDVERACETSSANTENFPNKKFDENNYCQNMLDKLTDDTKNVSENTSSERNLQQNIYEEESDSSENNELESELEVFRNDVHNNNENNFDNSISCSSKENKQEDLPEFKLCKACEEKHIDTRAYPCGHSYLCADCAVRLFRISKKCSICHKDIVEFVQFAS